jgi:hypothetical protein
MFSSRTIRDMIPMLVPDEDFLAVEGIKEQLDSTQADRDQELESINERLRGMNHTSASEVYSCHRSSTIAHLGSCKDFFEPTLDSAFSRRPCQVYQRT